jgi:hypothetical protein
MNHTYQLPSLRLPRLTLSCRSWRSAPDRVDIKEITTARILYAVVFVRVDLMSIPWSRGSSRSTRQPISWASNTQAPAKGKIRPQRRTLKNPIVTRTVILSPAPISFSEGPSGGSFGQVPRVILMAVTVGTVL